MRGGDDIAHGAAALVSPPHGSHALAMTNFCDEAWTATAALRAAIHALPFNVELANGSLTRERFRFYIQQDALYLGQFARVLAIAAAKAPDTTILQKFTEFSLGAITVERALHERYLAGFGISPVEAAQTEPAPDCLAYTSFLLATAYHEPWEVLIAALMPCFRIYWDVGGAIAAKAAPDNQYRDWIDTYADESFGAAVRSLMEIVDHAGGQAARPVRERMLAAYIRAAQYEYLFWDGAYNRRTWPLADATQA
ncbi:MAG TPA: thiaminase II [Stellaceae bacterium]|nr:thiaminase II [Stellaceae bacterium]